VSSRVNSTALGTTVGTTLSAATFGIEAEVLGSSPQARKNAVFAHALHFAA